MKQTRQNSFRWKITKFNKYTTINRIPYKDKRSAGEGKKTKLQKHREQRSLVCKYANADEFDKYKKSTESPKSIRLEDLQMRNKRQNRKTHKRV